MYDDVQVERPSGQELHAGKAKPTILKRIGKFFQSTLFVFIMAVISFSSGFSLRGTMDQKLIRSLHNSNSECIGTLKGWLLGRYGVQIREKTVDSDLKRI